MWSGGIDSTYAAAKLLKDTNHRVHLHHIHMVSRENRHQMEEAAVKKLAPILGKIRGFTMSESTIDHSKVEHIPYDMAVVCFEAGVMVKSFDASPVFPNFTHWTIGTHAAEGHWKTRWTVISKAADATAWPRDMPDFELPDPVTKGEEMKYINALGLLDFCWYCRIPRNEKPCGQCKACFEVESVSKGDSISMPF